MKSFESQGFEKGDRITIDTGSGVISGKIKSVAGQTFVIEKIRWYYRLLCWILDKVKGIRYEEDQVGDGAIKRLLLGD